KLVLEMGPRALLLAPSAHFVLADQSQVEVPLEQIGVQRYRVRRDWTALGPGFESFVLHATGLDGRDASHTWPLRARVVLRGQAAHVADLDPRLELDIPAGALLEAVALRAE